MMDAKGERTENLYVATMKKFVIKLKIASLFRLACDISFHYALSIRNAKHLTTYRQVVNWRLYIKRLLRA